MDELIEVRHALKGDDENSLMQLSLSHSSFVITGVHAVVITGFCDCAIGTVYYKAHNLCIVFWDNDYLHNLFLLSFTGLPCALWLSWHRFCPPIRAWRDSSLIFRSEAWWGRSYSFFFSHFVSLQGIQKWKKHLLTVWWDYFLLLTSRMKTFICIRI